MDRPVIHLEHNVSKTIRSSSRAATYSVGPNREKSLMSPDHCNLAGCGRSYTPKSSWLLEQIEICSVPIVNRIATV
jgi:hypothetical protein